MEPEILTADIIEFLMIVFDQIPAIVQSILKRRNQEHAEEDFPVVRSRIYDLVILEIFFGQRDDDFSGVGIAVNRVRSILSIMVDNDREYGLDDIVRAFVMTERDGEAVISRNNIIFIYLKINSFVVIFCNSSNLIFFNFSGNFRLKCKLSVSP